jgi:predicted ArsR family transcriptional regulator
MGTTKKALTEKAQGVLKELAKLEKATAAELKTTSTFLSGLVTSGHLKVSGVVKTGGRGRPSTAYVLTAKGRKVTA